MTDTMRNSGLPLIDDISWGSHMCVFYETRDDLFEAVARYLEPGLRGNELCIWRLPAGVTEEEAREALAARIDGFDKYVDENRFDVISASFDRFDEQAHKLFWTGKIESALNSGFEGLRGCGDCDAMPADQQQVDYEHWLADFLADKPALALCTYSLIAARAVDVFDVVRTHNVTVARRSGRWQFMEMPELAENDERIRGIDDALAAVSSSCPKRETLTEREKMVLAYLVKGASSKEAGRELGVSPRTIDFHRANIIEKLGVRNTAELVAHVLSRR